MRARLIKLDGVPAAAGMLRGMMIMEPRRAIMLGRRAVPDASELAAHALQCARRRGNFTMATLDQTNA
jgi:hypothetical protein